jgi:hypothetical protein
MERAENTIRIALWEMAWMFETLQKRSVSSLCEVFNEVVWRLHNVSGADMKRNRRQN